MKWWACFLLGIAAAVLLELLAAELIYRVNTSSSGTFIFF
jgi:hypothetical protein